MHEEKIKNTQYYIYVIGLLISAYHSNPVAKKTMTINSEGEWLCGRVLRRDNDRKRWTILHPYLFIRKTRNAMDIILKEEHIVKETNVLRPY